VQKQTVAGQVFRLIAPPREYHAFGQVQLSCLPIIDDHQISQRTEERTLPGGSGPENDGQGTCEEATACGEAPLLPSFGITSVVTSGLFAACDWIDLSID